MRHYSRGPHLADLQVNLASKDERSEQSHDIAKRVRDRLVPIARRFSATIQVSEVPRPPVLQTLVAEVYGPDPSRRLELAGQVKSVLEQTPGVVDVDWYVAAPQAKTSLVVDDARRCRRRHGVARVGCRPDGDRRPHRRPPARCECARGCPDCPALAALRPGIAGRVRELRLGPNLVAVGELTRRDAHGGGQPVSQELAPVTYVTGDLAGADESPVYAILRMNSVISNVTVPEGYAFEIYNTRQPFDTTKRDEVGRRMAHHV